MGNSDDKSALQSFKELWATTIVIAVFLLVLAISVSYYIVGKNHAYVLRSDNDFQQTLSGQPTNIIVLGSGVTPDGEPRPVLQQRLETTVDLYKKYPVKKIIVSGYFPYDTYNEPQAMKNYLISQQVPSSTITQDTNGNNTAATCIRAATEFDIQTAIVVTQPGHIDRTIYLCRALGIETYGYPAEITGDYSAQIMQSIREAFANIKAVVDVQLRL